MYMYVCIYLLVFRTLVSVRGSVWGDNSGGSRVSRDT